MTISEILTISKYFKQKEVIMQSPFQRVSILVSLLLLLRICKFDWKAFMKQIWHKVI